MDVARRSSLLLSLGLVLVGQAFLVAVAPLTRARGTFAETVGIAILVPDSRGYLSAAERFIDGSGLPWMRAGYPALLALADLLGDPVVVAVLLQLAALVAAGALLHGSVRGSVGPAAALIASAALLVNPMVAQWGRILVTESLFFAAIVALVALGKHLLDGVLTRGGWILYWGISLTVPFLRANGIFVLVSAVTITVASRLRGGARYASIAGIWLILLLGLPAFAETVGPPAEGSLAGQLREGVVVEGTDHVRTTIAMPDPGPAGDDDSLASAIRYATQHPVATANLAARRVSAEALQVRRHYPMLVNVAFGVTMLLYLAAGALGATDARARVWRALAAAFSLPLVVVTAATFASPEGRYGWAFLLPLAPLVGIGADRTVRAVQLRVSTPS